MLNEGPPPSANAYHQIRPESPEYQETRVLRAIRAFLEEHKADIDPKTLGKLEKSINTRMLNLMDKIREEYAAGVRKIGSAKTK
jgi:hypothetical protein